MRRRPAHGELPQAATEHPGAAHLADAAAALHPARGRVHGPGQPGSGRRRGGGGGGGGGGLPPTSGNAQISVSVQDDWGSGYCHNVRVTNSGTAPLVWQVTIDIEGKFNHAWSSVFTHSGSQTTFSGLYWNDELAPGESTSFGYCASR
ncbi:hypothetical protein F0U59_37690 [Archangium gephyra]|nr:hypothetical protein F0U59_37690 [Archangium gephyra]